MKRIIVRTTSEVFSAVEETQAQAMYTVDNLIEEIKQNIKDKDEKDALIINVKFEDVL